MRVSVFVFLSFVFVLSTASAQMQINEVCPMNYSTIETMDGGLSDWIELKNNIRSPITMKGWRINDKNDFKTAFVIPDTVIQPNDFLLLMADKDTPLKNSYRFNSAGAGIWHWKDKKGYTFPYTKVSGDFSFSFKINNWEKPIWTTEAMGIMLVEELKINSDYYYVGLEFAADKHRINAIYRADEDDEDTYWTIASEEYLTEYAVRMEKKGDSLSFFYRIDNYKWIKKHTILFNHKGDLYIGPAITSGKWGKPRQFDISEVKLNDEYIDLTQCEQFDFESKEPGTFEKYTDIFTGFKLSNKGETIYLFDNTGRLVDSLSYPKAITNSTYGRNNYGQKGYCAKATPQEYNTEILEKIATMPELDTDEQFFSAPSYFNFKPNAGRIFYTTNGDIPDLKSKEYTGEAFLISKSSVIRAIAYNENAITSDIYTKTIFIDEPTSSLDFFALTVDSSYYWNDEHQKGLVGGENWKRKFLKMPGHIEFFNKENNLLYEENADVKIHGRYSRKYAQKSHRLTARSSLGASKFDYPFFGDRGFDKYDKLIIRNAGNDFLDFTMNDLMTVALTEKIGLLHSKGRPVLMYLNGNYWGKYNLREKIDDEMISEIYDVSEDSVNYYDVWETKQGNSMRYDSSISKLTAIDDKNSQEFIDTFNEYYELENFIDYFILNSYINNRDWLDNNVLAWNSPEYDNKIRFVCWDTDFSYIDHWQRTYKKFEYYSESRYVQLMESVLANKEIRTYFLNRTSDLLNTMFTEENMNRIFDSTFALFETEFERHRQRWPESGKDYNEKLKVRREFHKERVNGERWTWTDYFEDITHAPKIHLTSNIDNPEIRISTIKISKLPWKGRYYEKTPIEIEAYDVPGYEFIKWEGVSESSERIITITLSENDTNLKAIYRPNNIPVFDVVINEIMYKAADESDTGDWFELYNNSDEDVDISRWIVKDDDDDHEYIFPNSIKLKSKSYLVVCKDEGKFEKIHPNIKNKIGEFNFGLGKEDAIRLFNKDMKLIDIVEYSNASPWPKEANGEGYSLELNKPKYDNSLAKNWHASADEKGSPGKKNSGGISVEETIELFSNIYPNPASEYVEFNLNPLLNSHISIVDLKGNRIYSSFTRGSSKIKIDISDFEAGVYVIQIESSSGIQQHKFIRI